jgi:sugar fermentation stimulation protein A
VRAHTLFEDCREARFVARPHRFTLLLELAGGTVRAYLPNTGRLEELTVDGGVFYVTPSRTGKFSHRAVSARYGGFPVLLDTARVNDVAEILLREKALPGLEGWSVSARGRASGGTRPDFTLANAGGENRLLEVDSCSLCHKGVALFPDTPRPRAGRAAMAIVVPHGGAVRFMPNFHTDRGFAERALSPCPSPGGPGERSAEGPRLRAYRVPLVDPATVDLDGVAEIPVDRERARANCTNAGSYLLVLRNDRPRSLRVGRLGLVRFPRGHYVYVGSALGSLDARVARHLRKRKKTFWHIDALTPEPMAVSAVYPIRRTDRIEGALAARVEALCDTAVEGFGASDAEERSHLFYFAEPPHRSGAFLDVVLDFRTFTEGVAFSGQCR